MTETRRVFRFVLVTCFPMALVALSLAAAPAPSTPGVPPESTPGQPLTGAPEGLSDRAWQAISGAIERDLYAARATGDPASLGASNPAQGYAARFTADGVAISVGAGGAELTLRLTGAGFGDALAPLPAAAPRAEGQRVWVARGAVTEWYVNRPTGLEQGWTLASPPGEAVEGRPLRLRLTLAVGGGFRPSLSDDGRAVELRDTTGRTRLRYAGLRAWDATDRELPARLEVASDEIGISVEADGAIYPVTVDPTIVNEGVKLLASDGAFADSFGYSVAVSGSTVVVGAPYGKDASSNFGSAYVFEEPAGGWPGSEPLEERAKLLPSDGAAEDRFGHSVSVSGSTVVVGAPYDDDDGLNSGSAYVFEEPVGGWPGSEPLEESAKLRASDGATWDWFGYSVAVSGSTVVVAAPYGEDASSNFGSAYVFEKPAGGWPGSEPLEESAKLLASDGAAYDFFGLSVAVSGSTVVVGAPSHFGDHHFSGLAYVFEEPAGGWPGSEPLEESAKLRASDGAALDSFGLSVAVSGSTVVVGAPNDDDDGSNSGSAYVFEEPAGGWPGSEPLEESAKLLASDGAAEDSFGRSVAVSGSTVVVGAPYDDDDDSYSGSAYVFEEPAGGWPGSEPLAESAKLLASDGATYDFFGESVAVSGPSVVAGAAWDDDNGSSSGSVYVFSLGGCVDQDGDGWGSPGDASCPAGPEADCDDTNDGVFPGAQEICDGRDNDCDGETDEGVGTDTDGDGVCDDVDADDLTAVCQNVELPADGACRADVAASAFDGGCVDYDGDRLTMEAAPTGPYSLGTQTVMLTVDDVHFGDVDEPTPDDAADHCTAEVTVVDTVAPVITLCPADRELAANDETELAAAPDLTAEAIAVDACNLALSQNPEAGSPLGVGTHLATIAATDFVHTTQCQVEVTVIGPGGCFTDMVMADQTIEGAHTYQAASSATLGPNLVIDGTDVVVNAPAVAFLSGVEIGGTFAVGNTTSCP